MIPEEFGAEALGQLSYPPTEQQTLVMAALARFICLGTGPGEPDAERVFLLNGYAGTGKTSMTAAVVKALAMRGVPTVLLAPTGRAAKVFGTFAGRRAFTIHRYIYRTNMLEGTMTVGTNNQPGAVFIVDEASMIGEGSGLLTDLVHYVYSAPGCRMILLGDTAQLPPVGTERSPAMDPATLRAMGLRVSRAVMTQTVRQQGASGVLWNATRLRKCMQMKELPEPSMRTTGFSDVRAVEGEELADAIAADYARDGMEETIVVTRSNSRATRFNLAIRSLINMSEEELVSGERLMIAKNNYHWGRETPGLDFIANGDMAVVSTIHGTEERYGLRFAEVSLTLPDRDVSLDCKIILDALTMDHPALDAESESRLREGVLREASGGMGLTQKEVAAVLRKSAYYNALRVKYAYAVTCHKAQGGQWANVYVDLGYIPDDVPGLEFYRWLYTAVTRTTRRLNLVQPAIATN